MRRVLELLELMRHVRAEFMLAVGVVGRVPCAGGHGERTPCWRQ